MSFPRSRIEGTKTEVASIATLHSTAVSFALPHMVRGGQIHITRR